MNKQFGLDNMVLYKTVLILEDDLKTLSLIHDRLSDLEGDQPYELSTIVLTNHIQVENLINGNKSINFDVILLDRDCKLGGSFHVFDIEKFGPEKVISISSVPEYNEQAKKRGVKRVIIKDNSHKEEFADKVVNEIGNMLRMMPVVSSNVHNII